MAVNSLEEVEAAFNWERVWNGELTKHEADWSTVIYDV